MDGPETDLFGMPILSTEKKPVAVAPQHTPQKEAPKALWDGPPRPYTIIKESPTLTWILNK